MVSSSSASRWALLRWWGCIGCGARAAAASSSSVFGAGVHAGASSLFDVQVALRYVQAAFFGGFVFPPPAAGAEVFAHG